MGVPRRPEAGRHVPIRMPQGRHFAVTWSIPDGFGGMTSALLQRSRAFRRLAGAEVSVLTFGDRDDAPRVTSRLREQGALIDGVHLVNLYDWLRENALPEGTLRRDRDAFTPLHPTDTSLAVTRHDGTVLNRCRRADDGSALQVDHYRADGSLLLSDRRDTVHRGAVGGRSVVLCDLSGSPVRSWRSIRGLYFAWLDRLTAGERSFMVVDSKATARFMAGYRRRNVVTVHLVHGSHLEPGDGADANAQRREVFSRLQDFDAVALLTDAQRHDVRMLVGRIPHLVVVPNAYSADIIPPEDTVQRSGGIVLARVSALKRVDEAIAAVQTANELLRTPMRLDVYGDGSQRARLERMVADDPHVWMHGHDPFARTHLDQASLLLATGRSEGFGLAILGSDGRRLHPHRLRRAVRSRRSHHGRPRRKTDPLRRRTRDGRGDHVARRRLARADRAHEGLGASTS